MIAPLFKQPITKRGVIFWFTILVIRNEFFLTRLGEKLLSTFTLNILCTEVFWKTIGSLWLNDTSPLFNNQHSLEVRRLQKLLIVVLFRVVNTVLSKNLKCLDLSFGLNPIKATYLVFVATVGRLQAFIFWTSSQPTWSGLVTCLR